MYITFYMAKILRYIPLALLAAACSREPILDTTIKPDPRAVRTYTIGYNEGIRDISKISRARRPEDVWFFDGKRWYDVGERSGALFTSTDLERVVAISDTTSGTERKIVHNHSTWDGKAYGDLDYHPPSYTDLKGELGRSFEVPGIEEEAVDGKGVWEYAWTSQPLSRKEMELVLEMYTAARNTFMMEQRTSGSNFDFNKAYNTLKTTAAGLGIDISYQPIGN